MARLESYPDVPPTTMIFLFTNLSADVTILFDCTKTRVLTLGVVILEPEMFLLSRLIVTSCTVFSTMLLINMGYDVIKPFEGVIWRFVQFSRSYMFLSNHSQSPHYSQSSFT